MVDGSLAPGVAEGGRGKGQVGRRGFLKVDPLPNGRRLLLQGVNGVGDADAAEVDPGYPTAQGAAQGHGGGAAAAAHIQHIGVGGQPAATAHNPIQVGPGLQEGHIGPVLEQAPMDAPVLVPQGAVHRILVVVILLGLGLAIL